MRVSLDVLVYLYWGAMGVYLFRGLGLLHLLCSSELLVSVLLLLALFASGVNVLVEAELRRNMS